MKCGRVSPILLAGMLALLSALGLIALVSTGGVLHDINPTEQQQTVNAIVQTRLALTAEMRATESAVGIATEMVTEAAQAIPAPLATFAPVG